jgi:25S rRNA (uracil2634-N3)-methyltransferase
MIREGFVFVWGAYNIAKKSSNGEGNARELEEKGGLVLYEVDAIEMSQRNFLRTQRFDRIVYNFPHVDFLFPEGSYCQIQLCSSLLHNLCSPMLTYIILSLY